MKLIIWKYSDLVCEYCLPPSERIGGRMCDNEVMDKED